jgi:hypothetical protein
MQVADDDTSVAWESLRLVSGLRSKLVERDVCREQLVEGVGDTVWLPERGDRAESHGRPTSPTTLTTSTASRSARFWSRLLRSERRRAGAGRLRNDRVGAA